MHQVLRLADYDDTPMYNTRAIVRMTQVKAPRLRAWERRYAVLTPHRRDDNAYRLYSERDIAIVRWLRDQIEAGMTVSQAIVMLRSGKEESVARVMPAPTAPQNLALGAMAHELFQAALRLDEDMVLRILRESLAVAPIETVTPEIIIPALRMLGDAWVGQQDVIMQEHFLSAIIHAQIDAIWHATSNPPDGPLALVGCVEGELHDLGSLILALFLRRAGVRVSYFGANIDTPSLVRLVKVLRPAAICLSVTLPEHIPNAISAFQQILQIGGVQLFIGGQASLPDSAQDVAAHAIYLGADSGQAVMLIKRTLGQL